MNTTIKLPAFVLLLIFAGYACSGKPAAEQPSAPVAGAAYFPLENGATLAFSGGTAVGSGPVDNSGQEWEVAAAAAPDGQPGFTISRKGRGLLNAMIMVYGLRAEGLVTWTGMFGASKTEFTPPFIELPATIAPGSKWNWSGTSKGARMDIASELEGIEEIAVPAGKYKCLRIRRSINNGTIAITQWYAEGKGLVKVNMKNPGGRVELQRAGN